MRYPSLIGYAFVFGLTIAPWQQALAELRQAILVTHANDETVGVLGDRAFYSFFPSHAQNKKKYILFYNAYTDFAYGPKVRSAIKQKITNAIEEDKNIYIRNYRSNSRSTYSQKTYFRQKDIDEGIQVVKASKPDYQIIDRSMLIKRKKLLSKFWRHNYYLKIKSKTFKIPIASYAYLLTQFEAGKKLEADQGKLKELSKVSGNEFLFHNLQDKIFIEQNQDQDTAR